MRINNVKIDGNNNIVIQNSDGSITTQLFDTFLKTMTFEKDEKIKLLEKNLSDKEKLQIYSEGQIETLKCDLEQSISEKVLIERKIDDLLNQFKNTDLSETNELFQNAITLFLDGDIHGALDVLSEDQLDDNLAEIENEEANSKKKRQQLAETYILKGHLLSLENSFEEAESKFIKASKINPCFVVYIDLGNFYNLFDKLEIAETYYQKSREIASNDEELANALYWLGKLEMVQHNLEKAYEYLNKSILTKDVSTYSDSESSRSFLADLYNSLGQLYQAKNNYELSKDQYIKSLEIRKSLVQINEKRHLPDLARSFHSMAVFYRLSNEFSMAKPYFFDAINIYEYLLTTSSIFLLNYATALNDIGLLFKQEYYYDEAKLYYLKSIEISREALKDNRPYFINPLAYSLNILGTLSATQGLLSDAEKNLKESLELRREMAIRNPKTNLVYVAEILINLGVLYHKTKRPELSKQSYIEALEIYEGHVVEKNSETQSIVAKTKHNLANLFYSNGEFENAESTIQECLVIRRALSEINPKSHKSLLASSLNSYAAILKASEKIELAEMFFNESYQIHLELLDSGLQKDYYSFAKSAINLSQFYQDILPDKKKSISLITEAIVKTYDMPSMDDETSQSMDLGFLIINRWGMSWDEFLLSIDDQIQDRQ